MPYSDLRFDKKVEEFIKKHKFKEYLDVGPGAGKYGRIIRKIVPNANIIGVEADKSYIKKFKLKDVYNKIHRDNIEHFTDNNPDFKTELVIIGDCLEHLKKSDGINLLHYLAYRAKYIIVVFPTKVIQYSWQGHKSEAHRSVWGSTDFLEFEHRTFKKQFMNLVIMQGFIGAPQAIYIKD